MRTSKEVLLYLTSAARNRLDGPRPAYPGAAVFGTEEQLAEAIGNDSKRQVEIWTSLPGVTPVKKFANRKLAAKRIWKAVQSVGASEAPTEQAADPQTPFDAIEPFAAAEGD